MSVVITLIRPALLMLALVHPPGGRGPDGDREGPPRPPPEAIDSCVDKGSGDACSFEGREGETVDGNCWAPSDDVPLACRPPHPPPRPSR